MHLHHVVRAFVFADLSQGKPAVVGLHESKVWGAGGCRIGEVRIERSKGMDDMRKVLDRAPLLSGIV